MAQEWGPWIEHDGRGCPCRGVFVHIEFASGFEAIGVAGSYLKADTPFPDGSWNWANLLLDPILRYRIRRPRALRELIELVETLPEREAVPA